MCKQFSKRTLSNIRAGITYPISVIAAIFIFHIIDVFNNSMVTVTDNTSCWIWVFWKQRPDWSKAINYMGGERTTMLTMGGIIVLILIGWGVTVYLNDRIQKREERERRQLISDITTSVLAARNAVDDRKTGDINREIREHLKKLDKRGRKR